MADNGTTATATSSASDPKINPDAALPPPLPAPSSTSVNYVLVASYVMIVAMWGLSQIILIPYVVHLLLLVLCILYAACHGSLVLLQDDDPIILTDADGNETILPVNSERETLRKEDAYQFPLIGSVSLFSLYCAFKFLDKDLVNLLIGGYFGLIGTFAVTMTLAPMLVALVPNRWSALTNEFKWDNHLHHPFHTIKWLGSPPSPMEWTVLFSVTDLMAAFVAMGVIGLYYYCAKPWYLNNILGISFCLQGIERFSLGTYKIGAILLIGLFFYDIFWVFGTDVMVTVAKNLDGPIKILLPRTLETDSVTGHFKDLSLLGLGDIVIPGFFLALLLRFDAHRYVTSKTTDTTSTAKDVFVLGIHDSFPKPYFHAALIAYIGGLGFTIFIMMQFHAAQPALLYLVPACLGSSFLTAVVRGEVKALLDYSEEVEEVVPDVNVDSDSKKTDDEAKKEK
jgi:minor histocompatibility antigen H13